MRATVEPAVDALAAAIEAPIDAFAPSIEPSIDAIAARIESLGRVFAPRGLGALAAAIESRIRPIAASIESFLDAVAACIHALLDPVATRVETLAARCRAVIGEHLPGGQRKDQSDDREWLLHVVLLGRIQCNQRRALRLVDKPGPSQAYVARASTM